MSLDGANTADSLGGASTPPSAGLQLDSRQRDMLQAMGITLWQRGGLVDKQPLAQQNRAQTAINNVAHGASTSVPSSHFAATTATSTTDLASTAPATRPAWAPLAAPAASVTPADAAPAERAVAPVAAPKAAAKAAAPFASLQPLPEGIAGMDWQQLQSAISTCQACALCEGRKNTVFGVGQLGTAPAWAPQADWLIVGDAPGENEDAQGEPFVGEAGKLLDNMLRAMRVDGQPLDRQHNVFLSNVLKCRPVADRNPSSAEVAMCQPYLQRQIALLQPKIILAMGRFAVQALTGSTEPLGKLRGRVHTLHGSSYAVPVVVTYHPAYLLRNLPDKAKAWADLLLAMEQVSLQK